MPIPTSGVWPPRQVAKAYTAYKDWDAWYTGNPDKLRAVYNGRGSTEGRLRPSQRSYPGQYSGGVVGRFSRWLWGTPAPVNARDARLHIPLPADMAAVSANLLFSEPPALSSEDTQAQAFLDRFVEDGFNTLLLHAGEACSALGDVYLRPVIDKEVFPDRAIATAVHADGAIPVIRWDKLVEVTFWTCLLESGNTYVRLLEHHDVVNGAGRITYALHEGTADQLGKAIPFAEHADAAYLAALVDQTGTQATGLDRLDVVRVANAGPQRLWRSDPILKYYGRSDFDGNESLFDQLDEVWTSWMRDVRLAKGRITVPSYMLQSNGPGQGAAWDPEREVYSQLEMLPNQTGNPSITYTQFDIRHAEHKATADALTEVIMRHAGFSNQTLGEEGGDVAITATEAQNRERLSFTTRGNRIQTWTKAIADYVELHMAVEAVVFKGVTPTRPEVDFGDSVSDSPETTARTIQLLAAADAISTDTKVRMRSPDWDDDRVREEVQLILEERNGPPLADPGAELGPPNGGPDNPADPNGGTANA